MIKISSGITGLAEEISSHYSIPVPLAQIAESEMIPVFFDDYGVSSFDGLTWFEPETDDFYIHINTAKRNFPDSLKGRFTLAHELGHYFIPSHRQRLINGTLKPHGSISFMNNQPAWQIEREADAFASSLLMPTNAFVKFTKGKSFGFNLLKGASDYFRVSLSATALRYTKIGDVPIMVVYAVNGFIRWACRSEDFQFWRLKHGNSCGDKVPENTVMGTYFYENDDSDCNSEEIIYAKDCFETRFKEENMRELIEWCIPFKNNILSIIWEKS